MADRTVSVKLVLDAAGYKRDAEAAAVATDHLDNKVQATDKDLKKLPRDASEAAAAMKLLGVESGKTRVALEDGTGRLSTSLGVLDQKLAAARAEVRKLADEFNRTGDAGTLDKLFKADTAAKDLEKLAKRLTSDLATSVQNGISAGGKEGAKNASASLQGFLSTPAIGPVVTGAIVAGVVAALPMIGGALTGAGGLGLLGVGIAAQFQSQQVKDAAGGLVGTLKSMFLDATASFRAPVEGALLDLMDFTRHLDLRSVFQPLAQFVGPLEKGLQGFLARLVGGLGALASNLKPVLDVLAVHLPQLGKRLEDFLIRISRHANENAAAFDTLLTVTEGVIKVLGVLIESFAILYKVVVNVALGIYIAMEKAFGWVPFVGDQLRGTIDALSQMAAEADGGAASLNTTSSAADGLNGAVGPNGLGKSVLGTTSALQQLDQATLQWKNDALDAKNASLGFTDALTNLQDQMKKNKAGFDETTPAGRQNVEALNALAVSAQGVADKTFAATGNSQAAAQAYKQARDQVLQLAIQGHATSSEIAALNQALDDAVKIRRGSIDIEVNLTGSGKALVTNQGTTILSGTGRKAQRWGGIYQHAEEGLLSAGIYPATNPARYAFAEPGTGGEAFVPRFGDYTRSMGILDQAARWYGGRVVAGGSALSAAPNVNVRVFIGNEEITGRVQVMIDKHDQGTAAAVAGGVRL